MLILAVDQATSKCCYYWLAVETEDLISTDAETVNDSIFSTSFVLFRLRASLPFSFEHLEQQGILLFALSFNSLIFPDYLLYRHFLERLCQNWKLNNRHINALPLHFHFLLCRGMLMNMAKVVSHCLVMSWAVDMICCSCVSFMFLLVVVGLYVSTSTTDGPERFSLKWPKFVNRISNST